MYVFIFAIAMGFMESAIVVYLREIYYPDGFRFPLVPIPNRMALVETLREAATIIMLVCTGYLAGRSVFERFAHFCLAFSVWDLFYYIFLYLLSGWPDSLSTWDILFLIPFPWVGPVWAPCLISLLMLAGSTCILLRAQKGMYLIRRGEWTLLLSGAVICILSFMLDYLQLSQAVRSPFSQQALFSDIHSYVPVKFNYALFAAGFLCMLAAVLYNIFITNKMTNHEKE
jgi:hypothetical protein